MASIYLEGGMSAWEKPTRPRVLPLASPMKILWMLWDHLYGCLASAINWKIQQRKLKTKSWWGEEKELCSSKKDKNISSQPSVNNAVNNATWQFFIRHKPHPCILTQTLWVTSSLLDMCDPNWHLSRVGLITSGFACSILVLILAVIIPFLLAAHWLHGKYCLIVFMQSPCTLVGGVTCRVTCLFYKGGVARWLFMHIKAGCERTRVGTEWATSHSDYMDRLRKHTLTL